MKLFTVLSLSCLAAFAGADAQTNQRRQGIVAPVVIARNQNHPSAIAVDETNVYWASDSGSAIRKVGKAGGVPTTLVTGQKEIQRIIISGDNIYFNTVNEIKRVNKTGGTPTTRATFASYDRYLAVDHTNVYFVNYPGRGGSQIMKVSKDGGESVVLASGVDAPRGLVSDGTNVYWINYADDTMNRVSVDGGTSTVFGQCRVPHDIAIDAESIYCTSGDIMKFRKADGARTMLTAMQDALIDKIALDEANVYAMSSDRGRIYKVSKNGGQPALLATLSRFQASNFAIDATSIYWTNPRLGTVMRTRK